GRAAIQTPGIDIGELLELAYLPAAVGFPKEDGAVEPAARGEILAVGGKGDLADQAAAVSVEPAPLLAGIHVPEADGLVPAARGERLAVRRESDTGDVALADRTNEKVERALDVAGRTESTSLVPFEASHFLAR